MQSAFDECETRATGFDRPERTPPGRGELQRILPEALGLYPQPTAPADFRRSRKPDSRQRDSRAES